MPGGSHRARHRAATPWRETPGIDDWPRPRRTRTSPRPRPTPPVGPTVPAPAKPVLARRVRAGPGGERGPAARAESTPTGRRARRHPGAALVADDVALDGAGARRASRPPAALAGAPGAAGSRSTRRRRPRASAGLARGRVVGRVAPRRCRRVRHLGGAAARTTRGGWRCETPGARRAARASVRSSRDEGRLPRPAASGAARLASGRRRRRHAHDFGLTYDHGTPTRRGGHAARRLGRANGGRRARDRIQRGGVLTVRTPAGRTLNAGREAIEHRQPHRRRCGMLRNPRPARAVANEWRGPRSSPGVGGRGSHGPHRAIGLNDGGSDEMSALHALLGRWQVDRSGSRG